MPPPPPHTHPAPAQPDKACRLRYKAKEVYVIYQILVHHGGCKCLVPKDAKYSKAVHCGVNQLSFAQSLCLLLKSKVDATMGP